MKSNSRMFAGIVFIAVGILFFLKVLGVLHFSLWDGFRSFWPIGLILVGLALVFNLKWLALLLLFLLV